MTRQPDEPITLDDAARTIFGGAISARVLRRAVDNGTLGAFRVGRKLFTTLADIRTMQALCRVVESPRAFTSTQPAGNGQSETDRVLSAQAALNSRFKKPNRFSVSISAPSTNRKQADRQ